MKKNRIFLLLTAFASLIAFSITVKADEKDYNFYEDKTIKKICTYSRDGYSWWNDNYAAVDEKYLFIYTDDKASVGWNAGGCERTNSNGKCADGYNVGAQKNPGVMNWSTVDTKDSDYGAEDAYEEYKKTGECPGYLAQAENGASNRFFLSAGSSAADLSNIKSASEKAPGTTVYYYYNTGPDKKNINLKEDLECEYHLKNNEETKIKINLSKNGDITTGNDTTIISQKMFSTSYQALLEDGKCPKSLDSCKIDISIGFGSKIPGYMIYGDSSVATYFCKGDDVVNFVCDGENCSSKSICQLYTDYQTKLNEDLKNYTSSSSSEKKKKVEQYNIHKDQFNAYCKSVLSTLDYAEGNCIDSCIELSKTLASLEKQYGLRSDNDNAKCGVGISIVNMVYNVLKWAKYIAPALVIILTMLDFIKAIAAQNDDDMKKAQGKFVKRLIVAALLFLLPLIINFILQTFGLYDSSCDITDLF